MTQQFVKFRFGAEGGFEHNVGDEKCPACDHWYPKRCVCGGLVHAHYTPDEFDDGTPITEYACDRCGENYQEKGPEAVPQGQS